MTMARVKMLHLLLPVFLGAYAAAPAAYAAAITNLDDVPYTFTLTVAGDSEQVNIAPGRTWRSMSGQPVDVQTARGRVRIDQDEEYAIRKGQLMLQTRRTPNEMR